jgi:tetratricopeptide (TPR) repeat protein
VARTASLAGGVFTLDERIDSLGGEIPAARLPAERDAFATAKARAPRLVAPADTRRRWDIDRVDPAGATQVQAIRTVFAKAIADDTDGTSGYTSRASLLNGIADRRGALADLTRAIAIAPSVDLYLARADTFYALDDLTAAASDAEAARALDPSSPGAINAIATMKAERGDLPGAVALFDERIAIGGTTRDSYRQAKASMVSEFGTAADALALYDALIAEKPGSPSLLNARCWTKGIRSVMLDTALKDCTRSIELSSDTSAALDSRALIWYRMGRYDDALADLDAVLANAPGQAPSHFLRGVVLRQLHREADAARDLTLARRMMPSVDRQYARYGIKTS